MTENAARTRKADNTASDTKSPTCGSPDVPRDGYVYFIRAMQLDRIKIGRSRNVMDRLRKLKTASPDILVLEGVLYSDDAEALERELHGDLWSDRTHGEWFDRTKAVKAVAAQSFPLEFFSSERVKVVFSPRRRPPASSDAIRFLPEPGETQEDFIARFYREAAKLSLLIP